MRHLNLIFQGGGVKGIAYAGVLKALPPDVKIHGVGGTSAGALVAALLAIEKRGEDLKALLGDPGLFKLISQSESERLERFETMWARQSEWASALQELLPIWQLRSEKKSFKSFRYGSRLKKFQERHHKLLDDLPRLWKDISDCWADKGLHSSEALRTWLDKVFGTKTFGELKKDVDLRIMAADVGQRRYRVFNAEDYGGMHIARAVHASVSFPIFFRPLASAADEECFVDGGVLSNFPSFMFDKSAYPTIGFRIKEGFHEDSVKPRSVRTALGYLLALIDTMVTAHDEARPRRRPFHSYWINTPGNIRWNSFKLKRDDVENLFNAGLVVGTNDVHWIRDDHSSEEKQVRYFDPDPDPVLSTALEQAEELINTHLSSDYWVDEIDQKSTLQARIDENWSTHFDRTDEITVRGKGSLLLGRIRLRIDGRIGRSLSLTQTKPSCVEEVGGISKPLIYIPAYNTETEKGFVVFYSPPVTDGQGVRLIRQKATIQADLSESVGKGEKDDIVFGVVRRATKHRLHAVLEIVVRHDFPQLSFEPPAQGTLRPIDGVEHRSYSWNLPVSEIGTEGFSFKVNIRRTPAVQGLV